MQASDITMQIVMCPACMVGHCFIVGEGGEVIYCGPVTQSVVTQGASVYMHPDDYMFFANLKAAGAMQDNRK